MANWLDLADAEFLKTCDQGAAKTAKTPVSAATAAVHPAIFRKKETPWNHQSTKEPVPNEQAKLDAHKDFPVRTIPKRLTCCDLEAGEIIAVEIASAVLGADIWLAFRANFDPQDGKAVFYADELPMLRTKTPEQLSEIYRAKLTFGPGARVRQ